MTTKLMDVGAFRDAARGGETPDATIFRFATTEPQVKGEDDERTMRFIFSDATVDHAGDSIDPKGWDLSIFKRNPVCLFSHASWEPPIGRSTYVCVEGKELIGDIEFASADIYPFAETIYQLLKNKYMNAVSVGFRPKEWAFTNDKSRPYGIDFKKQVLLEISICAVPCNPNALGEARSIGIDTAPLQEWATKILDSGETVFLPRKELEALRLQSKTSAPPQYYISGDRELSAKGLERMRESFKRWREDPNELLLLEPGFAIREISKDAAAAADTHTHNDIDPAPEADDTDKSIETLLLKIDATEVREAISLALKAGRRISAATKAKLQAALDMSSAHHDAMTKCLTEAMGQDGPDDPDTPDPDAAQQDALGVHEQPQGTIVPEAVEESLTPEERRLKEARALKASLPNND